MITWTDIFFGRSKYGVDLSRRRVLFSRPFLWGSPAWQTFLVNLLPHTFRPSSILFLSPLFFHPLAALKTLSPITTPSCSFPLLFLFVSFMSRRRLLSSHVPACRTAARLLRLCSAWTYSWVPSSVISLLSRSTRWCYSSILFGCFFLLFFLISLIHRTAFWPYSPGKISPCFWIQSFVQPGPVSRGWLLPAKKKKKVYIRETIQEH